MTEAVNLENSRLLENLRCAICIDVVTDTRLCPSCSQIFCQNCIERWLKNHSGSCPNCRSAVRFESLLRGHSIDKLRESTAQLISTLTDSICDKHKNHQLSLFCFHCEANMCVECWFSNEHMTHKDRAVLTAKAFNHYKQNLETSLTWIKTEKDIVDHGLRKAQDQERKLIKKKDIIKEICERLVALINSNAHPVILVKMLNSAKEIKKLQDQLQAETESARPDRHSEFVPKPVSLTLQITSIKRALEKQQYYTQNLQGPYEFKWECQVSIKDGRLSFFLRLVNGKSSEYSVRLGSDQEKIYRFELHKLVKIGDFNPTGQAQSVIVKVRQSYADTVELMQGRINHLDQIHQSYADRVEQMQRKIRRLKDSNNEIRNRTKPLILPFCILVTGFAIIFWVWLTKPKVEETSCLVWVP